MPTITDITEQQRNKDRVNIYIDGEYFCAMERLSAVKFRLKIGNTVDQQVLLDSIHDSECSSAFSKAIDHISRGSKTVSQMTQYLVGKGYSADIVDVVVVKLIGYKYLNDQQYANSYVSANIRTKGRRRIVQELLQKGIDRELTDGIELDDSKVSDCASALADKYMAHKDCDIKTLAKLQRYLVSRGYDYDLVGGIIDKYKGQ